MPQPVDAFEAIGFRGRVRTARDHRRRAAILDVTADALAVIGLAGADD